MHILHQKTLAAVIAAVLLLSSTPAWAQETHIASVPHLREAVQTKVRQEAADRAVVSRVLASSEARAVASQLGVNLTQAQNAVATLSAAELAQLASSARAADADLAAGASTIVISTTTLLLVLIIIILIAL